MANGSPAARGVQRSWSELISALRPGRDQAKLHSEYEPRISSTLLSVSAVDLSIAKQMFLATGLPGSVRQDLTGAKAVEPLLMMADTGRLRSEASPQTSLRRDESARTLTLEWERDEDDLWQIVARVDHNAAIIPCDPPLFLDATEGVIGLLAGQWPSQVLKALAGASGLTDHDMMTLRKNVASSVPARTLPAFPLIEVIDGGMIRPSPILYLDWVPYDASLMDLEPEEGDRGAMAASLSFDYDGIVVDYRDDQFLTKTEGPRRTNYERDRKFEDRCYEFIAPKSLIPRRSPEGVAYLKAGRFGSDDVVAAAHAYRDYVVPAAKKAGYRVEYGSGWPAKKIAVQDFTYTLTPAADGTYGVRMMAGMGDVDLDMVGTLVELFSNREWLAQLVKPGPSSQGALFPTNEHGYQVFIKQSLLVKLLPLISALLFHEKEGEYRLRPLDFAALEGARQGTDSRLTGGESLVALSKALTEVPPHLPRKTTKALTLPARTYQEFGANWCDVRRAHGFGGVVGDEYAVGKTLQTLLTIFAAHDEPEAKDCSISLIVVTKTLYFTGRWQEDHQKFLPTMQMLNAPFSRHVHSITTPQGTHALLTTYDTVVRQLPWFQERRWNVVACDEGHRLGQATNARKAIKGLWARQKLIITGSAMQNSPSELWSIMDIVVPGLLRERAWFHRTFPKNKMTDATPEETAKEPEGVQARRAKLAALGRIVGPFYLRRTNEELGRSLPKVIAIRRTVILGAEQARAYEAVRALQSQVVQAAIAASGLNKAQMHAQAAIMKLRRLCDAPKLVNVKGVPSAKVASLVEVCLELRAEGKKIVIVSQWVDMLELVRAELAVLKMLCVQLDGNVPGPRRKEVTDEFRQGDAEVLLIQLFLAEGIELPEGDVIILCDPWWNAKREEQAVARLRRDEREKHVTMIRMIVAGSIEERVLDLADRKLADIDALHEGHSVGGGKLTRNDIDLFLKPLGQAFPDEGGAATSIECRCIQAWGRPLPLRSSGRLMRRSRPPVRLLDDSRR